VYSRSACHAARASVSRRGDIEPITSWALCSHSEGSLSHENGFRSDQWRDLLATGADPEEIGEEVDFVIEAGGKLPPMEVKATSKPRLADCAHLRTFRQEYGRKARAGLLLDTGRTVEWLTPDVLAVPWWRVL
jgi:hypothetical protein